ncbi:MAG: 50S ribosomal protein L32 [Proteobacteria bacterium]|nr:50S ribosomal protein L32 [Pseudomonadota bacterium]
MAVPKFRTSKSKRDSRRSHHRLSSPVHHGCKESCSQASKFAMPRAILRHRACPVCGLYKNRQVPKVFSSRFPS